MIQKTSKFQPVQPLVYQTLKQGDVWDFTQLWESSSLWEMLR